MIFYFDDNGGQLTPKGDGTKRGNNDMYWYGFWQDCNSREERLRGKGVGLSYKEAVKWYTEAGILRRREKKRLKGTIEVVELDIMSA